ncbi:hypothetical protein N9164_16875 [Draconibacterium sp.]|nr:hypothetical protein [Draconibacterium sp.]
MSAAKDRCSICGGTPVASASCLLCSRCWLTPTWLPHRAPTPKQLCKLGEYCPTPQTCDGPQPMVMQPHARPFDLDAVAQRANAAARAVVWSNQNIPAAIQFALADLPRMHAEILRLRAIVSGGGANE